MLGQVELRQRDNPGCQKAGVALALVVLIGSADLRALQLGEVLVIACLQRGNLQPGRTKGPTGAINRDLVLMRVETK